VEYVHGKSGKSAYADFMKQRGYDVYKDISFSDPKITLYVEDLIFVKS